MPRSLRLLVADDEPLGAMALRSQLEAMGHAVIAHARDGRHAIDLARCFTVDAAILDSRMPELTGLEAAAIIFRHRPLPILVLSGFPEPETGERPPAYHYRVKPVDTHELQQGLQKAQDAFQRWLVRQPDPARIEELDRHAHLVQQARTLLARRHQTSQLIACQTLLRRARETDRPLHEIARAILQEAGESNAPDLTS